VLQLKQLRWQCRRGTKELDVILCGYLDQYYEESNEAEQGQFIALLALEDNMLLAYFFSRNMPTNPEIRQIVAKIRTLIIN